MTRENRFICDTSEPDRVKDAVKEMVNNAIFLPLDVGDFSDEKRGYIAERKEWNDFIASLDDGRYESQRWRLALEPEPRFWILEGHYENVIRDIPAQLIARIDAAIASLTTKYFIQVLYSRSFTHTIQLCKWLHEKSHELPLPPQITGTRISKESPILNIWASFPGISAGLAEKLHAHCSLLDIANLILCLEEDGNEEAIKFVAEVDGIGKKKAETIVKLLYEKVR